MITAYIMLDPIWTNLNQFDPIWTSLNQFEPICTNLIQFKIIWTNLIQFWTNQIQFESFWSQMIQFDLIQPNLNPYEPIWTNLIINATFKWSHFYEITPMILMWFPKFINLIVAIKNVHWLTTYSPYLVHVSIEWPRGLAARAAAVA